MGDLILMSPLVENMRVYFPQAKITLITREDMRAIYQHHPGIHEILTVNRKDGFRGLWNLTKYLRQSRWDILFDAHGSLRSVFMRTLISAQKKFVINKRTLQRLTLIFFKKNLLPFHYFKDQFSFPLEEFLDTSLKPRPTRLFRSPQERAVINQRWPFPQQAKVVGIVPSAQWPGKRWPLEHFQKLIANLQQHFHIAVFGGPEDTFCEDLTHSMDPKKVANFQGKLSLLESFEALSRCQLVVANDTGLMHAAEAVNTDVVALLGPTGEQFGFVPYRSQSDFLTQDMWCRPCSKNGQGFCIRLGRRPCLKELSVETVLDSVYCYFNKKESHNAPLP